MPKGNIVGKQSVGRLKINIQLFAKHPTLQLSKKEYGKIVREIDDLYYSKYEKQKSFYHYSGDYGYYVKNKSFNQYEIVYKFKLK
ncbi:MAG: hypothetical protein ACI4IK_01575 [Eubacterium sp.]